MTAVPIFMCLVLVIQFNVVQSSPGGCAKGLDVVAVVDGSDSIIPRDFVKFRSVLSAFVKVLETNKKVPNVHVGLVLYSSTIGTTFPLQPISKGLYDKISTLKHPRMGTNTALGIEEMRKIIRASQRKAVKVGIVITDGMSLNHTVTIEEANIAKKEGTIMFSAGIGPSVDMFELKGIASSPENVFRFPSFDKVDLSKLGSQAIDVCPPEPTKPPTTIPPTTSSPGLCAGCKWVNGAAYNKHKECDKYVQCTKDGNGRVIGKVRECAFPTYWSGLSCVHAKSVKCSKDRCRKKPNLYRYKTPVNCRGYWQCKNGRSEPKCCKAYHRFTKLGCVPDKTCKMRCFSEPPSPPKDAPKCNMRPVPGLSEMYEWKVFKKWVKLRCPIGTIFIQARCECVKPKGKRIQPPLACKPEVHLDFGKSLKDLSENANHIQNQFVKVGNGSAFFNGTSMLRIPRFTNVVTGTMVIKVTYKSERNDFISPFPVDQEQAIVSNANCDLEPSILITEDEQFVQFGARTGKNMVKTSVQEWPNGLKHVTYVFNNNKLTGYSNGKKTSQVVKGNLAAVNCALQIGHAENYRPFYGHMYELIVYLCMPEDL